MPKQDDKKTSTKKATPPEEKPATPEEKPAADKQARRPAKPSNPFLVERPPSKRGFRR